jgi:hypothetical protein
MSSAIAQKLAVAGGQSRAALQLRHQRALSMGGRIPAGGAVDGLMRISVNEAMARQRHWVPAFAGTTVCFVVRFVYRIARTAAASIRCLR